MAIKIKNRFWTRFRLVLALVFVAVLAGGSLLSYFILTGKLRFFAVEHVPVCQKRENCVRNGDFTLREKHDNYVSLKHWLLWPKGSYLKESEARQSYYSLPFVKDGSISVPVAEVGSGTLEEVSIYQNLYLKSDTEYVLSLRFAGLATSSVAVWKSSNETDWKLLNKQEIPLEGGTVLGKFSFRFVTEKNYPYHRLVITRAKQVQRRPLYITNILVREIDKENLVKNGNFDEYSEFWQVTRGSITFDYSCLDCYFSRGKFAWIGDIPALGLGFTMKQEEKTRVKQTLKLESGRYQLQASFFSRRQGTVQGYFEIAGQKLELANNDSDTYQDVSLNFDIAKNGEYDLVIAREDLANSPMFTLFVDDIVVRKVAGEGVGGLVCDVAGENTTAADGKIDYWDLAYIVQNFEKENIAIKKACKSYEKDVGGVKSYSKSVDIFDVVTVIDYLK